MNERKKLMRLYSAHAFAAWELHLYLDTHPNDKKAMQMYEKHSALSSEFKDEYEKQYGSLSMMNSTGCEWLKSPWPWEKGV